MVFTLRTAEGEKIYQRYKENAPKNFCPFCSRDLVRHEFKHWLLMENRFPYTKIAQKHDLLACKRHIKALDELTDDIN